jgi:hypothetical protein
LLGSLFVVTRRFGRHRTRVMQGVVAGAGLASLVWALHLAGTNVNRAYYGTDARAYQLLAGALLALSPGLVRRAARWRMVWVAAGVALVALLVVATSGVHLSVIDRGIAATVITAVLIVAIEAARRGPVNWGLSQSPLVYLGRISYGTYLWHWPVILVALDLTDHNISPLSLFAISALVATGLASLSYTILERPVREQRLFDRVNPVVIVAGLSISLVCALVVIPYILDPYHANADTTAQNNTTTGFTPIPNLDFQAVRTGGAPDLKGVPFLPDWNCFGKPSSVCTIIKGTGKHVLVIGDSTAWAMFPTFAKMAQTQHLTLSTAASAGCPWQRNLYFVDNSVAAYTERTTKCIAFKKDLYDRVIPQLKPDLIVAISRDFLDYNTKRPFFVYDKDNHPLPAADRQAFSKQVKTDTERSLEALGASGSRVMVVDPIPITTPDKDPFVCLTKSTALEQCRFVADLTTLPLDAMYQSLADNRRFFVANFDKLVCPFMPICDPIVNGQIVRLDEQHLTPRFAESLADPVAALLQNDRLIGG